MFDYRMVNLKLIQWLGENWMVSDWSSWLTQYVIPIQIQFSNKHIYIYTHIIYMYNIYIYIYIYNMYIYMINILSEYYSPILSHHISPLNDREVISDTDLKNHKKSTVRTPAAACWRWWWELSPSEAPHSPPGDVWDRDMSGVRRRE